jgi:hypothetical protein
MKRSKLKVIVCVLILAAGLSNHVFRFVEYHNTIVSLHVLQGKVLHCVQKSLIRDPLLGGLPSFFFPFFVCFDTIQEADAWMKENISF